MMSTKSRYCSSCNKASKACICATIVPIDNQALIVIIQHPSESKHPMGTARILELSLSRCLLLVTDSPEHELEFQALCTDMSHRCYLLYPDEQALPAGPELLAINTDLGGAQQQKNVFILLDATWRKAYGLLAASPLLQSLSKVQLSQQHQGRYKVRSTSVAGGLSTVEAAAHLLSALAGKDCANSKYQSLLTSLDKMVDFQLSQMPDNIKLRY